MDHNKFHGYVEAKLEDIGESIKRSNVKFDQLNKKVDIVNSKVVALQTRVAFMVSIISAAVTTVVTITLNILS